MAQAVKTFEKASKKIQIAHRCMECTGVSHVIMEDKSGRAHTALVTKNEQAADTRCCHPVNSLCVVGPECRDHGEVQETPHPRETPSAAPAPGHGRGVLRHGVCCSVFRVWQPSVPASRHRRLQRRASHTGARRHDVNIQTDLRCTPFRNTPEKKRHQEHYDWREREREREEGDRDGDERERQ